MTAFRIQERAVSRLDGIYRYTASQRATTQAERYQKHSVHWKRLADGDIGIVTILHQRMHQIERFRDDFGGKS
jgi:plasmid stabilization system protein ParE